MKVVHDRFALAGLVKNGLDTWVNTDQLLEDAIAAVAMEYAEYYMKLYQTAIAFAPKESPTMNPGLKNSGVQGAEPPQKSTISESSVVDVQKLPPPPGLGLYEPRSGVSGRPAPISPGSNERSE